MRGRGSLREDFLSVTFTVALMAVVVFLMVDYILVKDNGDAAPAPTPPQPENGTCEWFGCPKGTVFIVPKDSNTYHYCFCHTLQQMRPSDVQECLKTVYEARAMGYSRGGECDEP